MLPEEKSNENITVFIPKKLLNTKTFKTLYGQCFKHESVTKFYIISDKEHQELELIGLIDEEYRNEGLQNVVRLVTSTELEEGVKVRQRHYGLSRVLTVLNFVVSVEGSRCEWELNRSN